MISAGLTTHLHQQPLCWHFLSAMEVKSFELCLLVASAKLCSYAGYLMTMNTFEGYSSTNRFITRTEFSLSLSLSLCLSVSLSLSLSPRRTDLGSEPLYRVYSRGQRGCYRLPLLASGRSRC